MTENQRLINRCLKTGIGKKLSVNGATTIKAGQSDPSLKVELHKINEIIQKGREQRTF